MLILIDIGNTNIKYQINDNPVIIIAYQDFNILERVFKDNKIQQCYIANVNKKIEKKIIELQVKNKQCIFKIAKTRRYFKGIKNAYVENYKKLGIDRWLAIIAGTQLTSENFVVILAGSAITIDFIKNKIHLGGFILPGFKYINDFYSHQINLVSEVVSDNKLSYFSNTTNDAINTGKHIGYKLIFKDIVNKFKIATSNNYSIIISGGNATNIQSLYLNDNQNVKIVSNIILQGLREYYK